MTTTGATSQDEIITGPKPGEDSLANDLDNRREVTQDMLLGGHPNQEPEEKEETPAGGTEVKPGEETKKPGETLAPEGEKPLEGETPPEGEKPPAGPRFKSQEEAEKAHAEAERRMTMATTEAAETKKALEKAQQELEELRQAQPKPPEKEEKPVVKASTDDERMAKIVEAAKTANLAAVPKLRALDPEDPDYEQKYSDIMAEVNVATAKALLEVSINPASLTREEVEQIYQEKLDAERKKGEATEAARIETKAKEMGIKLGLNLDDPESADSIIWDRYKTKIPQEVFDKNSLEAQVEWVVAEVRRVTGKMALTEAEKEEAARIAQENNQPLGKGGSKPKSQLKQEKEGSLADDFAAVRQQRIL